MATLTQEQQAAKQTSKVSSLRRLAHLRETAIGYVFLAPFLILYIVLKLYPIVEVLRISRYRWDIIGSNTAYVGWENYERIWDDRIFWSAVRNTLEFTAISTPLLIAGGLFLAIAVNQKIRGMGLFRSLYYMPNVLSVSVIGVIFAAFFGASPDRGFINAILVSIGIDPIPFLLDTRWAMQAVAFTTVWWTVGFNMLIFLAGLQDIPDDVLDAARVDGAGRVRIFQHITLPYLRRAFAFVAVLQVVASFQVFGQIDIMTSGGPAGQTRTLMYYIFERSFTQWQIGYGAAISVILLIALFVISIIQIRLFSEEEDVI